MQDAFKLLGATPLDNAEKLRELFENKQLFVDDDKEINLAYSELTNLKKRIKHEIRYYSKTTFSKFNKLFVDNNEDEQSMALEDMCSVIIKVGKWFDGDINKIFSKINADRAVAKFSPVGSVESVQDEINEMKNNCISAVKKYFEYLQEKDLIALFTMLVSQEKYMSFFVDELLAHYEIALKESIEKKEKASLNKFKKIENQSNEYLDEDEIPDDFEENVEAFKKSLVAWDKLVQPLQINATNRGMQHSASFEMIHNIRNKVIEIGNSAQEKLNSKAMRLQYDYSGAVRASIPQTIQNLMDFNTILISILDILLDVFSELDVEAEQLTKDIESIENFNTTLDDMLDKIDPYRMKVDKREDFIEKKALSKAKKVDSSVSSPSSSSWNYSNSGIGKQYSKKNNTSSNDENWRLGIKWIVGFVLVFAFFTAIAAFQNEDIIGLGVFSLLVCIVTGICAYQWGKGEIEQDHMRVLAFIMAGLTLCFFIATIIVNNSDDYSDSGYNSSSSYASYTVTLDKEGGTGGSSYVYVDYGDSMPYATAPTRSGYTFGGYYLSENGNGTQYYDKNMNSKQTYYYKYGITLYAYWIKDGISLTKSNFTNYFNLSSSCSVSRYDNYSSGTATYSFSISPKSSFNYSLNSKNPETITVVIGLDITGLSYSYGSTPSEYKITVILYKNKGYSYSGTRTYTADAFENYWDDGIYSVDAIIYN